MKHESVRQPSPNTRELSFTQDKSVLSFDGTETPDVPKYPGLNQALDKPHTSFPGANYSYEAWIFYDESDPKYALNGKVRFLVLDNDSGALVKEFLLWIPGASIISVEIPPSQQSNGEKIQVNLKADRQISEKTGTAWCTRGCTPAPGP